MPVEFIFPKTIHGTFYEADGTTAITNNTVYLYNKTTDALLATTTTDSLGHYVFNLREIGGWSENDDVRVWAGRLFARYVISNLVTDTSTDYRFYIDVEFLDNSAGEATISTNGLNMVRDWFRGNSTTTNKGHGWGIGTTSPVESDAFLELEKERNAFTSQSRVNNKVTYESILAKAEGNTEEITKSGIFTQGDGGGSAKVTIDTTKPGEKVDITVD